MISKVKEVLDKLEFGFLELFTAFFMVVGLLGYFGSVSADLDWLDHTVSFIMFTYFFYLANISSLLFGKKNAKANSIIVISFFILFFNNIISYTEIDSYGFTILAFLKPVSDFISHNLFEINVITFYIGLIGLFLVSLYLAKSLEISHPSFTYALFKRPIKNKFAKFLLMFSCLLAFYYLIYNPILEWLEFVLDDPIIAIGIIFYISKIARHHAKFRAGQFVFKIGEITWKWYTKFISLFHYRKTLPLAISGILMLHSISELGVFAYSLIFGKENFYLELIQTNHSSFLSLFLKDATNDPSFMIFLFSSYVLNAISLIVLLAIPIFVWVRMFMNKELHIHNSYLFFIYASIAMHLLLPAYTISPINEPGITGVDISTISLLSSSSILQNYFIDRESLITAIALTSLFFGLMIFWMAHSEKIKKELYALAIVFGLSFYAIYLYYFFQTLLSYILQSISILLLSSHFIIIGVLAFFLIVSFLFYTFGFGLFVYEIVMEHHRRKWSDPIDEDIVSVIKDVKKAEKRLFAKKAQIAQEIFKYMLVLIVSGVIIIAGYKSISVIRERACQTQISEFEINFKGIDKNLRPGQRESKTFNIPCNVDQVFFFDKTKKQDPNLFDGNKILMDSIASNSNQNVFLVKDGQVKRSFYAGNLDINFPYHICFKPKFAKFSFYAEGLGEKVRITGSCEQPECTLIPINISEDESRNIVTGAIYDPVNPCEECMQDYDLQNMKLTREKIDMFRRFSVCDGITMVEIVLKPKGNVNNFRFYEYIPKRCIDDLDTYLDGNPNFEQNIVLRKNDPLIVWNFDELDEETTIKYRIKTIEEECQNIIKGIGVSAIVPNPELPLQPCKNTDVNCGMPGNCIDCTASGLVCYNNLCQSQSQIILDLPLDEVDVYSSQNNVLNENLWKYTIYPSQMDNLQYSVSQSNPSLVDCYIKSMNSLMCDRMSNSEGISEIKVTVTDGKLTGFDSFKINMHTPTQSCQSVSCNPYSQCLGNVLYRYHSATCTSGICNYQSTQRNCASEGKICQNNDCVNQNSNQNPIPNQPSTDTNSFQNTCTAGSARCIGNSRQLCEDSSGISQWGTTIPCPPNQPCQNGNCGNCVKDQQRCYQEDIWYFDTCNQPESKYKECGNIDCFAVDSSWDRKCKREDGIYQCCCIGWFGYTGHCEVPP